MEGTQKSEIGAECSLVWIMLGSSGSGALAGGDFPRRDQIRVSLVKSARDPDIAPNAKARAGRTTTIYPSHERPFWSTFEVLASSSQSTGRPPSLTPNADRPDVCNT